MPKATRSKQTLNLPCDDSSDTFIVRYTNMGEPYREGIQIGIENTDYNNDVVVMLGDSEAIELRDMLMEYYPIVT